MKKKDIKSGMVVKLRKGCWCLAIMHEDVLIFASKRCVEANINNYDESLMHNAIYEPDDFRKFDIVSVGKVHYGNMLKLNEEEIDIIWERDSPIELTIRDIEEKLGYKIKIV